MQETPPSVSLVPASEAGALLQPRLLQAIAPCLDQAW